MQQVLTVIKRSFRNVVSAVRMSAICTIIIVLITTIFLYFGVRSYIDDRITTSTGEVENYISQYMSEEIAKQTIVKETVVELKPDVVYERSVAKPYLFTTIQLDVEPVLQYPELPTGCEVTALTTVLWYYGLNVDKLYLAEKFLPKGTPGEVGLNDAFLGNPASPHGYGCYAPVIKVTAEKYLSSLIWLEEEMTVQDLTGTPLYELEQYIVDGIPVMIWASVNMVETRRNEGWDINGETVYWMYNEHCLVLIGFTETEYIFADPLNGIKSYEKELVNQRYGELGQQAVVIY